MSSTVPVISSKHNFGVVVYANSCVPQGSDRLIRLSANSRGLCSSMLANSSTLRLLLQGMPDSIMNFLLVAYSEENALTDLGVQGTGAYRPEIDGKPVSVNLVLAGEAKVVCLYVDSIFWYNAEPKFSKILMGFRACLRILKSVRVRSLKPT